MKRYQYTAIMLVLLAILGNITHGWAQMACLAALVYYLVKHIYYVIKDVE